LLLYLGKIHQMVMSAMLKKFGSGFVRSRRAIAMLLVLPVALTAIPSAAQTTEKTAVDRHVDNHVDHYYEPLPQETGTAGLKLMLRRLQTTARLMQVTAHPDDEDGGMLTLESRGKGVSTLLMSLTRGEGGQNKLGSNLFDVLGVLRTLELLASDRYYGVEQRFSRVADFGYSKTPEETFQKWQGHDIALADMVRVIRTFRPDVLVARFSGTDRDGHGHHQASAILTKEAFRAAGDPKRFPEQIAEGLDPWQPKKLYVGNVCGFGAMTCDAANYTLRLNTGVKDAVLGTSYVQFAMKGLRHQQSQGAANWTIDDGDRFTYYKLVDSVVESPKDKDGHEQDFFDGIDTTLVARLGDKGKAIPWMRGAFEEIQGKIDTAERAGTDAAAMKAALDAAAGLTSQLLVVAGLPAREDTQRLFYLGDLLPEIEQARALLEGAKFSAIVDAPVGATPDEAFMAVPGEPFDVTAKFSIARMHDARADVSLRLPKGWKSEVLKKEFVEGEVVMRFRVQVPAHAQITRPYWHRKDPERDTLNIIDDPQYQNLPFPPVPVEANARFADGPLVRAVCMVRYKDSTGAVSVRPLAVAPAFSVLLDPSEQVIATEDGPPLAVRADVESNVRSKDLNRASGTLLLEAPVGWRREPAQGSIEFDSEHEKRSFDSKVIPGSRSEGHAEIRSSFNDGRASYKEGYSVVTREDLGTFYYYQPALQHVSIVDVKVPKDLKVGYVMGAGDDIPTVLQQVGMDVILIPAEKLSSEDLSRHQTIVLGIRAYDTQKDVIANNKRLLDFVQAGGRLVVQYNTSPGDFNAGKYTPYPTTLGRARVSVEEAPVAILDPANPIFHSPNEITQKDFEGWVQERGLYFMSQWDSNFTPLLESHDPGEGEQKGGLLVAHYGKGTYIYTGYAFFRQLPAGVPGAARLFVNLVSGR
jgi:LmbE family N-acetylglucosaminyl deacetylase